MFRKNPSHFQWCKFDDDVVSRASPRDAILANFGGDDCDAPSRTFTNAYMLVYVKQSSISKIFKIFFDAVSLVEIRWNPVVCLFYGFLNPKNQNVMKSWMTGLIIFLATNDWKLKSRYSIRFKITNIHNYLTALGDVLAPITDDDIPHNLRKKFENERIEENRRKKEKMEAHLYTEVIFVTESAVLRHHGYDLINTLTMDEELPKERVEKELCINDLYEKAVRLLSDNRTMRPGETVGYNLPFHFI